MNTTEMPPTDWRLRLLLLPFASVGLMGRAAGDLLLYKVHWPSADANHQVQLQFQELTASEVSVSKQAHDSGAQQPAFPWEPCPPWLRDTPLAFDEQHADAKLQIALRLYHEWTIAKFPRSNGWLMGPCSLAEIYLVAFFSLVDFLAGKLPCFERLLAASPDAVRFKIRSKSDAEFGDCCPIVRR